ncbi:MAG TPA: pilus assembly protein PilM, partial [Planctomycetota bacterium]|nr:pilus assembly protein PilM [Planctomycetota bacterium]
MALVVGLDIGTHSLTGAVFSGTAKKFRLIDFFKETIPTLDGSAAGNGIPVGEYVPPPSLEDLIQRVLVEHNLKSADMVVALDAKDCIIREIPVSFTREDQIEKVIAFEAENFLPTLNIDDVILEYLKVGESNGKSQVILFGVRQDLIATRLETLKRAGVDPIALDLDAVALFNAFAVTPLYNPARSTLLVDMGGTSTKIVLVEAGQLKKVRSFRIGSRLLSPDRLIAQPVAVGAGAREAPEGGETIFGDYSIEARFQEIENALRRIDPGSGPAPVSRVEDIGTDTPIAILSDEDYERFQDLAEGSIPGVGAVKGRPAEQPKRLLETAEGIPVAEMEPGLPEEPALPGGAGAGSGNGARGATFDYRAYLERIGVEVQRTLATSRISVELICLTGGMSGHDEARRYFSEEFDVETIQFDFGDSFATDLDGSDMAEVSQYGAVAVGLAVKELGHDLAALDFRKGRFRYEHRFTRLRFPLLVASALAFAFFLQTAFWSYHEHGRLVSRADGFEQRLAEVYRTFFEKPPTEGRSPLVEAQEQQRSWQGKGAGDVGKSLPYVELIRNFGEVLNSANLEFVIKSM